MLNILLCNYLTLTRVFLTGKWGATPHQLKICSFPPPWKISPNRLSPPKVEILSDLILSQRSFIFVDKPKSSVLSRGFFSLFSQDLFDFASVERAGFVFPFFKKRSHFKSFFRSISLSKFFTFSLLNFSSFSI